MYTLRNLALLAALIASPAAFAQVPATAGAASDTPMPPEPGERRGTDRTLTPGEARGTQAYAPTLSEQREMGLVRQNVSTDLDRLDRDYTQMERNRGTMSDSDWSTIQQSRTTARQRFEAMPNDDAAMMASRDQMMQDYSAYNNAVVRAQLQMASPADYDRMVTERMTWYNNQFNRYGAGLRTAPENMRAERAQQLIQMRRQYDQLNTQYRRIARAPEARQAAMRREFANDFAMYDSSVRTSTSWLDQSGR